MVDYKSLHNNKLGEPKTLTPGPWTLPSDPGACFSKLLKLFERIDTKLFVFCSQEIFLFFVPISEFCPQNQLGGVGGEGWAVLVEIPHEKSQSPPMLSLRVPFFYFGQISLKSERSHLSSPLMNSLLILPTAELRWQSKISLELFATITPRFIVSIRSTAGKMSTFGRVFWNIALFWYEFLLFRAALRIHLRFHSFSFSSGFLSP